MLKCLSDGSIVALSVSFAKRSFYATGDSDWFKILDLICNIYSVDLKSNNSLANHASSAVTFAPGKCCIMLASGL